LGWESFSKYPEVQNNLSGEHPVLRLWRDIFTTVKFHVVNFPPARFCYLEENLIERYYHGQSLPSLNGFFLWQRRCSCEEGIEFPAEVGIFLNILKRQSSSSGEFCVVGLFSAAKI
jgi:hypothetical protein